jgi:hypothetical protein
MFASRAVGPSLLAALLLAAPLPAQRALSQRALPPGAKVPAAFLQMRPRVGDTLRMRLDQQVEMSGSARVGDVDSTITVTTRTRVLTHSVVERSEAAGTTMLAVTDSVLVSSTKGDRPIVAEQARPGLQGRRVQLLVAPDGATRVVGGGEDLAPELHSAFQQMPAMLPRDAVAVGDSWTRTMSFPGAGPVGKAGRAAGLVAVFRLDSLTRDGELAHVSLRGTLSRDGVADSTQHGLTVAMTGAVVGSMGIDRRRGWLTDAHTTLTVRSTVAPRPGAGAQPMKLRMKVTQWLRAL